MTDLFETITKADKAHDSRFDPVPDDFRPSIDGKKPEVAHAEVGTPACNANILAEEWRVVPGWPEYEVSSAGKVKRIGAARGAKVGRVLRPWVSVGYHFVALWRDDSQHRVPVHRLVALAFLPDPQADQYQVAHRNGNRLDNRPTNLRWSTPTENAADRLHHGTDARGEKNPRARLTAAQVVEIRTACASGRSHTDVARQFNLCRQTVSDIANRRRWSHVA